MKFLLQLFSRSALWAILPESLEGFTRLLLMVQGSQHPGAADATVAAQMGSWEAAKPSMLGSRAGKIAVVPVEGVLTKDGPSWYGSNYEGISRAVESAVADPEVKHIVLSVDSPGGEVTGLPETAAVIAEAAKTKPVTAMVNGMAASAAYYLASQARDIVATPSGDVGSVGVRMMHMDVSRMMDTAGVTVTELYSGDHKTEWSPFKPLSQEAIDAEMPRLKAMHQGFIDAVNAGRGERLSQQMRESRMGEGRMFSAKDALNHGLVDRLQSSRDFYRSIVPESAQTDAVSPRRLHEHRVRKS